MNELNDIRILGLIVFMVLGTLGLLFAKLFAFSYAFILWPWLICMIFLGIVSWIISNTNV